MSVEVSLGESASLFEEMEIVTKFVEICDESNILEACLSLPLKMWQDVDSLIALGINRFPEESWE